MQHADAKEAFRMLPRAVVCIWKYTLLLRAVGIYTSFEGVCVTTVILAPGACEVGSAQHCLPPFRRESVESVENLENVPCSGRLDFVRRRSTSEHLAPPEVALVAGGGSVEASGLQN